MLISINVLSGIPLRQEEAPKSNPLIFDFALCVLNLVSTLVILHLINMGILEFQSSRRGEGGLTHKQNAAL